MQSEPTVFVVDDDPAMRQSLRWLLQSVGLPAVKPSRRRRSFWRRLIGSGPAAWCSMFGCPA